MTVNKLTQRWLYNSFLVIFIIVCALVVGSTFGLRGILYNNARQVLHSRANTISTLLTTYSEDPALDYMTQVQQLVETFEDRNIMELMVIDENGDVLITSSGFEMETPPYMPDYHSAKSQTLGTYDYLGMIGGENTIAVTHIIQANGQDEIAIRLVSSLTQVDNQIIWFIILITFLGLCILFFVLLSSTYFINSIIIPIGKVGETAEKIAQGDFGARLDVQTDDEIGRLCHTINHMAAALASSEQMQNDFISSVSHELRTPLTAIKGWSETLQDDELIDPEMRQKGLGVIIGETERLSTMVEELLDFSRMQSGKFKLTKENIDIVAELSDAVLMFTERAKREHKQLIYDELLDFVPIYGDRNRLRQIFINIIDNALKYSDSGDTVKVSAETQGQHFLVRVSDSGVGISAQDLPKIKTKFYKGNTTRRGSGIGLAVASELVEQHGGTLTIASTRDIGTTVSITLPILEQTQA